MKHPRMKTLAATVSLSVLAAAGSCPAAVTYTSDVFTMFVGIEADWAGKTRLDNAHVDIQIGFPGLAEVFHPTLNFGHPPDATSDGIIYGLDEAFAYGNSSTGHVLDSSALATYYAFTGASEGDMLWNLEQSNTPGMIFLGFNTKDTEVADLVAWNPADPAKGAASLNTWIKLELVAVRGPGSMSVYLYDAFGGPAQVYMATHGGIDGTDAIYLTPNSHNHFNWAFSSDGLYEVDFRITTMVVPEPGTFVLAVSALTFCALSRRKRHHTPDASAGAA